MDMRTYTRTLISSLVPVVVVVVVTIGERHDIDETNHAAYCCTRYAAYAQQTSAGQQTLSLLLFPPLFLLLTFRISRLPVQSKASIGPFARPLLLKSLLCGMIKCSGSYVFTPCHTKRSAMQARVSAKCRLIRSAWGLMSS